MGDQTHQPLSYPEKLEAFFTHWALQQGGPRGLGGWEQSSSVGAKTPSLPPGPDDLQSQELAQFAAHASAAEVQYVGGGLALYREFVSWYRKNHGAKT